MDDRGGHVPPPENGGEFFLHPRRKHPFSRPPPRPPARAFTCDSSTPYFAPRYYFAPKPYAKPDLNHHFSYRPRGYNRTPRQCSMRWKPVISAENSNLCSSNQPEVNLNFGSLNAFQMNAVASNGDTHGNSLTSRGKEGERNCSNDFRGKQGHNENGRAVAPPLGFSSRTKNVENRDSEKGRRTFDHNADSETDNFGDLEKNDSRLSDQIDSPDPSSGGIHSVSVFDDIHESVMELRCGGLDKVSGDGLQNELDDLEDQVADSLRLEDRPDEKSDQNKHRPGKDYRYDNRGQWIMGERMRNRKRWASCRGDIHRLDAPFLAVFESLIPVDEEKVKQKQLLSVLEKLISSEWPEARLHLYGSCANSFGISKSDMDVCLAVGNGVDKCEVLLKLAGILRSENLQNVQALTHARVPVLKLMDPVTSISCDICINNMLAVENTKLLRDYARIDFRVRQLAFIVKHWARSRGVNETYRGTLSSYAYVLMCIHFLQQRRPAILPCLQRMETTYFATVDNVGCSYFDQVEKLGDFGARNGESIAQLVWAFFHYWAYCHDYTKDVISVRVGGTISKRDKDWTRRVGNDRHLICIEDPFEVSHDLGRVVDKYSVRVLREEFERAAEIMQNDPNPFVTLFDPYIRN